MDGLCNKPALRQLLRGSHGGAAIKESSTWKTKKILYFYDKERSSRLTDGLWKTFHKNCLLLHEKWEDCPPVKYIKTQHNCIIYNIIYDSWRCCCCCCSKSERFHIAVREDVVHLEKN